jgi:hypothetical protein
LAAKRGFKNFDTVRRTISTAPRRMADQVIKAMDAEMKIELREVVRRTPEDTGDLRNTERVEGPERDGNRIIVSGRQNISSPF